MVGKLQCYLVCFYHNCAAGHESRKPISQSSGSPEVPPVSLNRISEIEKRMESLTKLVEAMRRTTSSNSPDQSFSSFSGQSSSEVQFSGNYVLWHYLRQQFAG
jgi:hypothetical protein